MGRRAGDGREERTLARDLVQAGQVVKAGEKVRLRAEQIARLEPRGYFEVSAAQSRARDGGQSDE